MPNHLNNSAHLFAAYCKFLANFLHHFSKNISKRYVMMVNRLQFVIYIFSELNWIFSFACYINYIMASIAVQSVKSMLIQLISFLNQIPNFVRILSCITILINLITIFGSIKNKHTRKHGIFFLQIKSFAVQ